MIYIIYKYSLPIYFNYIYIFNRSLGFVEICTHICLFIILLYIICNQSITYVTLYIYKYHVLFHICNKFAHKSIICNLTCKTIALIRKSCLEKKKLHITTFNFILYLFNVIKKEIYIRVYAPIFYVILGKCIFWSVYGTKWKA